MRNRKIKTGLFVVGTFFTVFFFFGGGSLMKPQVARAWDLNDSNNYIIPNSIYLDYTGNLNFDWARGIANHLQGAPGGYLSLSLNGTSTDGTALIAQSSGQPGYCRGVPDDFGADSQDTYGNHDVFTQVYDAQAGQVVSTQGRVWRWR